MHVVRSSSIPAHAAGILVVGILTINTAVNGWGYHGR